MTHFPGTGLEHRYQAQQNAAAGAGCARAVLVSIVSKGVCPEFLASVVPSGLLLLRIWLGFTLPSVEFCFS